MTNKYPLFNLMIYYFLPVNPRESADSPYLNSRGKIPMKKNKKIYFDIYNNMYF